MPATDTPPPAWGTLANTLIHRLSTHHGVMPDVGQRSTAASELDMLFEKFKSEDHADHFGPVAQTPLRHVPARRLLMAIRLAATFGSTSAIDNALHCGALTVIRHIPILDLNTLKDVLNICFPRSQWQILAPDTVDGGLSKTAQAQLHEAVADSCDRIDPVLILQTEGPSLPRHLMAMSPDILNLAPICTAILIPFLQSGHLSGQIADIRQLRTALPKDDALAELDTIAVCAAMRAPNLEEVLNRLHVLTKRDGNDGPRLAEMTGDTPALRAARRLVADLLLWKAGKAGWADINRSLLLYGPPGTGKTYLACAIGNSAGLSVVSASFGAWQAAGHLGDMLREMRASFSLARRRAPCVLVIDEIDAAGSRSSDDRHGSNYRLQVISAFLTELDGISREEGVILVGTTNRPDKMDAAILRAGRLDVKAEVPLPDAETNLAILRHHLTDSIVEADLETLARQAVGKSAADIDAAIRAARSDARHQQTPLNIAMVREKLGIGPTTENLDMLWRIAVHEAGHAVLSKALNLGSIDRIRVAHDGGRILRRTAPHAGLLADYEAEIAYCLGGRAAEQLLLGEVSAGAGGPDSSDLAMATHHAIQIETTLGIGHEGPVWHAKPFDAHLSTPAIRDRVRQRLMRAEQRATMVLTQHRDTLESLARDLLDKRSLRAAEINAWLCNMSPKPIPECDKSRGPASRNPPHPHG